MANAKISALSAAAALDGTELGAGVQAAANVKITPAQLKTYCRTRKEVSILGGQQSTNPTLCMQSNYLIQTDANTIYRVIVPSDNSDLYYIKSTNGGVSWSDPVVITATINTVGIAVWFDKWTPGDAGTVIHIVYIEDASDDVLYKTLNTATDTVAGPVTVFDGATAVASANTCLSITKSVAGRILVGFDIDSGTEVGFYKSDDYPVTAFTSKTDLNEAVSDYYLLFPGGYADTADINAVFWDRSANEITIKTYDDSGNSWAESAAIGSMTDIATSTVSPQFTVAVVTATIGSLTSGDAYFVAWENSDTATAKLRCWHVAAATGVITEKTNVVSSSGDDQGACAITIDPATGNIIVFYLGLTSGADTAYTSMSVNSKTSTDGAATWGAETTLTTQNHGVRILSTCPRTYTDFVVLFGGLAGLSNVSFLTIPLT